MCQKYKLSGHTWLNEFVTPILFLFKLRKILGSESIVRVDKVELKSNLVLSKVGLSKAVGIFDNYENVQYFCWFSNLVFAQAKLHT